MAKLHKQTRQLNEDQLQQELDRRLTKSEQQDAQVRDRVADAVQNSKGKYVAGQVEQIRRETSDQQSDINSIGDFNNFKFNNRQFAAKKDTAQTQEVEDESEEKIYENKTQAQEVKVENNEHTLVAHSAKPEPAPQPEPPQWTATDSQEMQHQHEQASGHQASASWTHKASIEAPKPEAQHRAQPRPEAKAEDLEQRDNSPFRIPKLEALKTQGG